MEPGTGSFGRRGRDFLKRACTAAVLVSAGAPVVPADAEDVSRGRLAPCPDRPNCVSSKDVGTRHHIEPLRYTGDMATAKARLLRIVRDFKRTQIIEDTGPYIHVTFTSRIFRFTDDVEFQFDDAERLIDLKSASRVGYSDLGVNRRRCNAIRKAFEGPR